MFDHLAYWYTTTEKKFALLFYPSGCLWIQIIATQVFMFHHFHSLLCIYRFDGFTSTFQDKLFKGYDMEIHNQIFYTTICSCLLSLSGTSFDYGYNLFCTPLVTSFSRQWCMVKRFPAYLCLCNWNVYIVCLMQICHVFK